MKPQEKVCSDASIARLEQDLDSIPSKPDQRRRGMRKVIERLRVSELAAQIALRHALDESEGGCPYPPEELWNLSVAQAIELRRTR